MFPCRVQRVHRRQVGRFLQSEPFLLVVVGEAVELPDADVLGGLVCCAEGENGASDESRRHETLRTAVSELRDAVAEAGCCWRLREVRGRAF